MLLVVFFCDDAGEGEDEEEDEDGEGAGGTEGLSLSLLFPSAANFFLRRSAFARVLCSLFVDAAISMACNALGSCRMNAFGTFADVAIDAARINDK